MSTTALQGLLEYLYGTLTPKDMCWVADHLIEHAQRSSEPLKRLTMEEVNAMLDEAEADIAAGRTIPHDEVMRRWDEEIAQMEQVGYMVAEA